MRLLIGTVTDVIPPEDQRSATRYQHEYYVLATDSLFTQVPLKNVLKMDMFGAPDEFSDAILRQGQMVLVTFIGDDYTRPVIIGALRNSPTKTSAEPGDHWLLRYNKINQKVDAQANWSVTSDSGPLATVKTDSVILDDASGERITLDKTNGVLTVEARSLKVVVKGAADVQVEGDATVSTKNATVTVNGDAKLEASGKVDVKAGGDVAVEAAGNATVDAAQIELNGGGGQVLTTQTQPRCYVSGIPYVGVSTVKAG